MSSSIINIENVNKWFGDFQVLKDINLEVQPKQKIVVCGPSGSGKSTLIRCINRLEEHQEGKIIVDGTELSENTKNIEQIRALICSIFFVFSLSSVPSTIILPSWCSSNLLIHLIKVDLPEPDGPQTTIFCFGCTSKLISFKTWKSPNHLLTFSIFIIELDIIFQFYIFPQGYNYICSLHSKLSRKLLLQKYILP